MTGLADPREAAPVAERDARVDVQVADLVATVRARAPFYAACWAGLPAVRGVADLVHLPSPDKAALLAASPPYGQDALTGPPAAAYVFRSGGTTGKPKFALYGRDEFAAMVEPFRWSYHAAGLRGEDRVANLLAVGHLYASFIFVNRLLEELGCLNLPFTSAIQPEVLAVQARAFGVNALVGFPSVLLPLAAGLAAEGVAIEKVFYAGEHLQADDRDLLARSLGATTIASAGYGAVDAGLMGYACDHATGGIHHVLAEHLVLELLDPATGQPVSGTDPGEVVVTQLGRRLHPVVRYRVGDMARWVPGDCPCGRTAPRFELLGRGDDALRIGYASVMHGEIAGALGRALAGEAILVQLVKQHAAGKDRLVVRVETAGCVDAGLVAMAVLGAKADLGRMQSAGTIHPLEVEVLAPGGMPRAAITGKFRRTIDETLS